MAISWMSKSIEPCGLTILAFMPPPSRRPRPRSACRRYKPLALQQDCRRPRAKLRDYGVLKSVGRVAMTPRFNPEFKDGRIVLRSNASELSRSAAEQEEPAPPEETQVEPTDDA
jgi:hypothetical protein